MKNPWVIIGLVTVLLFAAAFYFAGQAQEANNDGVVVQTQVKGNPDATVILEKFSDFECPACRAATPFVEEVLTEYGDQLRFEYKHFPIEQFHHNALAASMAAEAAGQQGKFFEFHDLLFENQDQWRQTAAPITFFTQYAEQLELDMDLFRRHSNASVLRDKVRAEQAEGRDRGVTGTPTFFLNGVPLKDAQNRNLSFAEMAARIALAVDPVAVASTTAAKVESDDPDVVGETTGTPVRFGI